MFAELSSKKLIFHKSEFNWKKLKLELKKLKNLNRKPLKKHEMQETEKKHKLKKV